MVAPHAAHATRTVRREISKRNFRESPRRSTHEIKNSRCNRQEMRAADKSVAKLSEPKKEIRGVDTKRREIKTRQPKEVSSQKFAPKAKDVQMSDRALSRFGTRMKKSDVGGTKQKEIKTRQPKEVVNKKFAPRAKEAQVSDRPLSKLAIRIKKSETADTKRKEIKKQFSENIKGKKFVPRPRTIEIPKEDKSLVKYVRKNDSPLSKGIEEGEKRVRDAKAPRKIGNGKEVHNADKSPARVRRTAEDFAKNKEGMDRTPESYSVGHKVPLKDAYKSAPRETGIYILWDGDRIMKCGVATHDGGGIRWRMGQYYNLNYDNKARSGDFWSVSPKNRDRITVSWQACPQRVCNELEYKAFQKHGKGDWAARAPRSAATNEWKLLI